MKKIITALGNSILNNELRKYEKYDVPYNDLIYQDAVTDVIENKDIDILVISSLLQGQLDFIKFIDDIKSKNNFVRIIIISDIVSEEMKSSLFARGIFDIFCDNCIEVKDILEAIDREEPITKRIAKIKSNVVEEENVVYVSKIQKQEIVTVSGINGSGKSTIIKNLAEVIAKKTDAKVLVIDLDTISGNLNELFDINKIPQNVEILLDEDKKCGLNYASELITKNRFDANVFEEIVIKKGRVDILTGNTSLHFCQNVLNEKCYDKILEVAKEIYDFILIDTSSNIFLDSTKWALQKGNRVLFVTCSDRISLKKMDQFLYMIFENWKIWREKIKVVINKENNESVEPEVIENIYDKTEVVCSIKYGEAGNEENYEKILQNINYIPKESLIQKIKNKIENVLEHCNFKKGDEILQNVN